MRNGLLKHRRTDKVNEGREGFPKHKRIDKENMNEMVYLSTRGMTRQT